ncbi:Heavy metal transport/detoxification superfamily protein, partial [Striga hermonthica]
RLKAETEEAHSFPFSPIMGEKNQKNNEGDNKKKNNVTVVLKVDLHCEGCTSKVVKRIRSFDGVDTVTAGEGQKITVVGSVDPAKLREKVEQKTRKKVELISPQPKKGDGKEDENGKKDQKSESKEKKGSDDKSDQKKSKDKEVFKLNF